MAPLDPHLNALEQDFFNAAAEDLVAREEEFVQPRRPDSLLARLLQGNIIYVEDSTNFSLLAQQTSFTSPAPEQSHVSYQPQIQFSTPIPSAAVTYQAMEEQILAASPDDTIAGFMGLDYVAAMIKSNQNASPQTQINKAQTHRWDPLTERLMVTPLDQFDHLWKFGE